jgi:hypothetical protein
MGPIKLGFHQSRLTATMGPYGLILPIFQPEIDFLSYKIRRY